MTAAENTFMLGRQVRELLKISSGFKVAKKTEKNTVKALGRKVLDAEKK